MGYKPSLFIQFKKKDFLKSKKYFKKFKITEKEGIVMLEIKVKKVNLSLLKKLNKQLKPLSVQYLFTKTIS